LGNRAVTYRRAKKMWKHGGGENGKGGGVAQKEKRGINFTFPGGGKEVAPKRSERNSPKRVL